MPPDTETLLAREAALRDVLQVISASRDNEGPVFDKVLHAARTLCGADTAALMLGRPGEPVLTLAAANFADAERTATTHDILKRANTPPMHLDPAVHISAQAILSGAPVHIHDLGEHGSYKAGEPTFVIMVEEQGHRATLSVPLLDVGGAVGAINLHRSEPIPFSEDEIALVESFAAEAVIAIENVRQFKALEALNAELGDRVQAQVGELERMGRLKRFLPEQVADAVVSSGDDRMLSSHRALIAALFCDMRGFTAFCETAEPEETIEVLQTYHEEMGHLIAAHSAGVDHRAGDGIMVLFNDPLPCDDPAGQALRLAFAMRARMADLCARWHKMGHRLGFGVGVSLGYATVGMVGSEGRFHYTASGTAVNLAARLCDMAKDGEILLSPRAAIAVEEQVVVESLGEVEIKGISAPVEVMRAVGPRA